MIATKQLSLCDGSTQVAFILQNPDMSAVSFAMTVHGLMDYELDLSSSGK
ncbi:MAG: hypothetical protein ACLVIY_04920 [Anaerobutyricum soehngenii]